MINWKRFRLWKEGTRTVNEGGGWANDKATKASDVAKILHRDVDRILAGGKPKGGYSGDTGEIFSWGERNPRSGMSYTISISGVEETIKGLK